MNENNEMTPLPLPRLVVRLGGLGNRDLGDENGIDDAAAPLWTAAKEACASVLEEVEQCLIKIRDEELGRTNPHCAPEPPKLVSRIQGRLFGQADRWNLADRRVQTSSVFTAEPPLVSLLSGDAKGADTLIRNVAQARHDRPGNQVSYELLRVTPEDPGQVLDGLGVGSIPAKQPGQNPPTGTAPKPTRSEARAQAEISRRRAYGYRAQSAALRHHSDLLLAIWDPDAEGKAGGTAESVEAALRDQIPVVAVRIASNSTAVIHVLEHPRDLHARLEPNPEKWKRRLEKILRYLLAFPDEAGPANNAGHSLREPVDAYQPRAAFAVFVANQPFRPLWPGGVWRKFDAWTKRCAARSLEASKPAGGEQVDPGKKHPKASGGPNKEANPKPRQPDPSTARYELVRKRASSTGMSGLFGDAHRGGIILSYILAALAVLLAIGGTLLHAGHAPAWLQAMVALLEVVSISLMWALQVSSTRDGWNAAYSDARILSEALRVMQFLAPLGVHTPLPRLPHYLRKSEDAANPDRLWSIWYFRALVRMSPLRVGAHDLEAARKRIEEEAHQGQRSYHLLNACKHRLIHHWIERLVPWVFRAVALGAGLHFLDLALGLHCPGVFEVSLFFCIGGPALIAALHGFTSQMELLRLRARSSSMARLLEERSRNLAALDLSNPAEAGAVWGLATEALATADLIMDETAGWSMLYRNTNIHAG